jgi:hypothetical protein
MNRKYVRETAAGKSISAYVILKDGREVATVQMHHGAGCLVNVWQRHGAYLATAAANGPAPMDDATERAAFDLWAFQQGRATGYGYDKETAALSGLWIDGHELSDHCDSRFRQPAPDGGAWPRDAKAPAGWSFTNWSAEALGGAGGWRDCYRYVGLGYLEALGYSVIRAI